MLALIGLVHSNSLPNLFQRQSGKPFYGSSTLKEVRQDIRVKRAKVFF